MKRLLAIVLCLVMVLSLAGCVQPNDTPEPTEPAATEPAATEPAATEPAVEGAPDPVKIGVLIPLSGAMAYQGELMREGYQFAADYYNSVGGIKSLGGAQIELVFGDHTCVAEVGATEFERMVNEGCVAISGFNNAAVVTTSANLSDKYKVPSVVSLGSVLAPYKEGYEYFFNPEIDAITNSEALVGVCKMINEEMGGNIDSIGYLVENSEWGFSQMESFEKIFNEAGITTAFSESFEIGTSDFSVQISKLKESGVKFVIPCITSFNDAVMFVRQMREYECPATILACGGVFVVPELAETLGEDANGIISTDCWNPDFLEYYRGPEAVAIHEQFIEQYGHKMSENSGLAFVAMSVLVAAIEEAASYDSTAIRDALYNIDLDGDSEYMLMVPYDRVVLNEVTKDGLYGRNVYGFSLCSQLIDGEWRLVYPNHLVENNPLTWDAS